ncbi:MAG: family 78 glycoside hydrolase catalytic domain [Bryobacterales bacterium]|nr:family 78 glycoside hydrolase catalytic domain [Bryobacterales bacterium]
MRVYLFGPLLLIAASLNARSLIPVHLQCEGQDNPIAVETARPRLSWKLRAAEPGARNLAQSAYQILVASTKEMLARNHGDLWNSGKVASRATFEVAGPGKPAPEIFWWKARVWDSAGRVSSWSGPAFWRPAPTSWAGAKWISGPAEGERMPVFRKSFRLTKPVARALLYVSGLGQYEFSLNARKVGDAVLAPGWTNYRKTVLYDAYDVSSLLAPGENTAWVMLGNGMYHVAKTPGRYTKFTGSMGEPKMIARLHIEYAGGGIEEIVSDASWQAAPGPILYSHTYGGEDYDARRQPSDWQPAREVEGPGGRLTAASNPPIRVMQTFHAVDVTTPRAGIRVYDLGQNFSGWPVIRVQGPAGAAVKLIPGELLDAGGLVTQRSSGQPQWYTYTLRGGAAETWAPRFSYYGFRYVQVEAPASVTVRSLTGEFIHAAAPVVGEFSCSSTLFNRIHQLILAAIRSNMQSVLTDCPHREKLGWLEQSHLAGPSILYNFDAARLYAKIANDIRDSQLRDGLVPDIAPEYTVFSKGFRDSPEWGSAAILNPWLVYRFSGDPSLMASQYEVMSRYAGYLSGKAQDRILSYGLGDWYDIGPGDPGVSKLTALGVTATAIYYADLEALRHAAFLNGQPGEAARWQREAAAVRQAFNARFYSAAEARYDRGSQCSSAMALVLGLVPERDRARLLDRLVSDVRAHANHTTAGDIGYHFVIQALSEGGRSDVIYDMLSATDPPSYAAQLRAGATSLTEAWDSDPRSSQNHFMLGHAEEWFYRYLAGIDFDLSRPPDQRITLRPTPAGSITWAHASYNSVLGRITSSWKKNGSELVYQAEVPPNATATVLLPAGEKKMIGSGRWTFRVRLQRRSGSN